MGIRDGDIRQIKFRRRLKQSQAKKRIQNLKLARLLIKTIRRRRRNIDTIERRRVGNPAVVHPLNQKVIRNKKIKQPKITKNLKQKSQYNKNRKNLK